jgi:DNA-binding transcriptional LysR family regulator
MNVTRFKHLLSVADEASFARAAAHLGIKQPPLSQSIARLERDLGVVLLERTKQGVKLTKAGAAFMPEARAAVAAADRAVALAKSAARAVTAVRVGVVSLALWDAVPAMLVSARKAHLAVQLEQASTNEQLRALAHGELDIGFVVPPFDKAPRLRTRLLTDEPVVLAVPAAMAKEPDLKELLAKVSDRLILFPRAEGPVLFDAVLRIFTRLGHHPKIVQESARMLTTLALVGAGVGASIVPAAVARQLTVKGVVYWPLARLELAPTWPLALAHMPLSALSAPARLLTQWQPRFLER